MDIDEIIELIKQNTKEANTKIINYLSKNENLNITKYLVEKSILNIEIKNEAGYSILHNSVRTEQYLIIKYLIDIGADIYTLNNKDENILYSLMNNSTFLFSGFTSYLIDQNINYDFNFSWNDKSEKFLNVFLSKRCYFDNQRFERFKIFEALMIKQFFKHNKIFQKVPDNLKDEVQAHIKEITETENSCIGIDEYTKQVIIRNADKPINELVPKYYLMFCKNHQETSNDKARSVEKTAMSNQNSSFLPKVHIHSLKILAALAIDSDNIYNNSENKLVTQDLVPYVIAVNILELFLLGKSVDIIID